MYTIQEKDCRASSRHMQIIITVHTLTLTQMRKILSLSKRKKKKQDLTTRAEHIRLDEPFAGTLVCACIIKMLLLGCAAVAEVLCNYNGAGIYYIYHTHS